MQAERVVSLILLSLMTRIVQSKPGSQDPVLTLHPDWPQIYTGENITLRYCSASVKLTVSALPRATLTVEPKWRPLYTGETVTLKCGVDSLSNWKYVWYKGRPQTVVHNVTGDRYSITAAAESDQGQYWCEGRLEGRNVTSQRSDSITLTVKALPRATLTVEPKWRPLDPGETVTLKCGVDSLSNWTYVWYKDQIQAAVSQTVVHNVTGDRYSITAAAESDQGQYWCEGRLEGRNVTSQRSDSITLTVKDRLLLGLGAPPLLLASIILCVKWYRNRGSSNEAAVKFTEENVEINM
ncbi:hypothetical protein AAFF_G00121160 [Aldrovandia affinis]|uniref:Ig-like domain-containing protein n=1 Tax=Aldrovandia affinis TaxID=143900 RepID=A0AAD7R358_9TELE|nr:hypothetical protein AAFF_G00121160 [Aldrovandia affinis]